jgi:hypothetical protein
MNENYAHPDMPEGAAEGIIKGMYLLQDAGKPKKGELRVQLLGSGTILREAIAAAELLDKDFGVTSRYLELPELQRAARDGFDAERWNRLHPEAKSRGRRMSRSCWKAARAGDCGDRLRAGVCRSDSCVRADALHGAGHGWIRAVGYAREPASPLRSGSLLHRACGDCCACGKKGRWRGRMWRGRSSCTRSITLLLVLRSEDITSGLIRTSVLQSIWHLAKAVEKRGSIRDATVNLSGTFSSFRIDMSDSEVFLTQDNEDAPALRFTRESSYYKGFENEFYQNWNLSVDLRQALNDGPFVSPRDFFTRYFGINISDDEAGEL